ncbi:unnamed protein product [Symbiodinium sp. CCMP2592]|nr:unnamed protein product [Symbiodinium sp. CCMP2592]
MGAGPSCNLRNPHQLDIEAVDAAKPQMEVFEIHNATQCSEKEKHGDANAGASDADQGMSEESRSESDDSGSHPRVRISKALTVNSKELMRGISIKETLRSWGHLWRQSPIDLPEKERAGLWTRSRQVTHFHMFLSHSWATSGRWKYLALSFQHSWPYVLLTWLLALLVVELLTCLGLVPVISYTSFSYQGFTAECPFSGLGLFVALPLSVLTFFLAPYFPDIGKERQACFLDVVSINQVDPEMMRQGIYGLGGFLNASEELRILYSAPYLTRLWCVFELAAFRRANPSGRIRFAPLFVEIGAASAWLGGAVGIFVYWLVVRLTGWRSFIPLTFAAIPFFIFFHMLRKSLSQKRQVFHDLATFELSAAGCRNAVDKEFIYAAIENWYGSLDAFTSYVRGPLRDELLANHLGTSLPWNYTLLIATPWITLGMDALAAQVRGGFPFRNLVSYGSGVALGLFGFWWITVVQFVMLLAGRFPMSKEGRWGLAQSFVLYLVCVACIFSGAIIGHWAYKDSVAASLAWCFVSGMLASLSSGLKVFKSAFGRS